MNLHPYFRIAALAAIAFVSSTTSHLVFAGDYAFRVHNSTSDRITKILVSENRKSWGAFNIGRGISAGSTTKLVWDSSTDNEGCEQWIKAVFDDGSETKPAKFDFCEKDLEISF